MANDSPYSLPYYGRDQETQGVGPSPLRKLLSARAFISFSIAAVILVYVFVHQGIPLDQVWANLRRANPALYALGFVTYYCVFYVRAARWGLLLRNAHYTNIPKVQTLARIIYLSWFANSILPAKLGDGYRGYLLKRSTGSSFMKNIGNIIAERVVDICVLLCLLVLSGVLAFGRSAPSDSRVLLGIGALLAGLCLGVLLTLKLFGMRLASIFPQKLRPSYRRLEEGLLLSLRTRLPAILSLTVASWMLESLQFWFVAHALGVGLSFPIAVFVALSASLLTTVPFTPAGLGVVEGAVITALMLIIHDKALAGSLALLDRTITYWSILVIGAIVYTVSRDR